LIPGDLPGDIVNVINQSGKPVMALDIPSGMDANTGDVAGVAIKARLTATFVAPKVGFYLRHAIQWTGRVEIIDIGLPRQMLRRYEE
jgi:NAD(P)H-hydrate epimerase